MTRKEAKEYLINISYQIGTIGIEYLSEKDGIKMREAIETLEQEPCDDSISRQAVLAIAGDSCLDLDSYEDTREFCDEIEELPSVTPRQKNGWWINAKVGKLFPSNDFKCSECGNLLNFDGVNCGRGSANYCPNCEAKMRR